MRLGIGDQELARSSISALVARFRFTGLAG